MQTGNTTGEEIMTEKRSAEPASVPNLRVPEEEAVQRITTQIKKGYDITGLSIISDEDLEKAQREESKWSKYNVDLLARLFDNTSLAEEYQIWVSRPLEDVFEDQVERFRKDVADRIAKLESILERLELMALSNTTRVDASSIEVTREGVYVAGQYFDALERVRKILSRATRSIVIIDGYPNEDVLSLLTSKETGVEVNIMTRDLSPALKIAAIAFNKQYGKLPIRTSQAFHDRFLIIDDNSFYHLGASIKDLGRQGFMFSRIEELKAIETLRKEFTQEWAKSKVAV